MESGGWKLFYDDGTTFSSEQGKPQDSPHWGVIVVLQNTANKSDDLLYRGYDVYIFREDLGHWLEVDHIGLMDQLTHFAPEITAVRSGRWVPTGHFKATLRRAQAELDERQVKS